MYKRQVPHKGIEIVPDGMVLVFIRHNPDGIINLLLIGKPIGFFQIEKQIPVSYTQLFERTAGADGSASGGHLCRRYG